MPFKRIMGFILATKIRVQMYSYITKSFVGVLCVSQNLPGCGSCYSKIAQLKNILCRSQSSTEKSRLCLMLAFCAHRASLSRCLNL